MKTNKIMNKIKLFLLTLFVCLSSSSFSQKKKTKPLNRQSTVEGIGPFKIHKTNINIIDSLKKLDNEFYYIKTYSDYSSIKFKDKIISEVLSDSTKEYNDILESTICPKGRVFYIPEIVISDITIKDLFLTFYNETLINIKCEYSSELLEAFKLKYGKPTITEYTKEYKCIVFGNIIRYKEVTYYQRWFNKDIEVLFYIGSYRDSKCDSQSYLGMTIGSEKKLSEMEKCSDVAKERIKKRKESEKIEKYKKL